MPVSVLSSAISEKLSQKKNEENFADQLAATTKRVLLTKIEYEEATTQTYANVFDKLKNKYTVLELQSNTEHNNGGNSSYLQQKSQEKLNSLATNDRNIKATSSNGGAKTNSNQNNTSSSSNPTQLPQPKKILYSRDNVVLGWQSHSQLRNGKKWGTGAGMYNAGNTCYLNSTLQALFHVPAIANWLVSDTEHREKCEKLGHTHNCIICAMATTLEASQYSGNPIKPNLIYGKLSQICRHLTFGRQEDAHEFLRYLIEAMEKSYLIRYRSILKELDQHSKETTPLNQILGGYLRSTVTCLSCNHVSTTFQHFEDLLLDISNVNNIESALRSYFAKEKLEDSDYKCESCKRKVSATKKFTLERAPLVLCVQLKRFSVLGNKLMKNINIGEFLDLKPHLSKASPPHEKYNYRLTSMVTHIGNSQHCGHYTAIGLSPNGSYYQFDDSSVRPVTIDCVLRTNAYILFYELVQNRYEKQEIASSNNGFLKNGIHSKFTGANQRIDKIIQNSCMRMNQENTVKTGVLVQRNGESSKSYENTNGQKPGGILKTETNSPKSFSSTTKPTTPISSNKTDESQRKSLLALKPSTIFENETTPKARTNFVTPLVPSCLLKQQNPLVKHEEATTPTKSTPLSPPTTPTTQKSQISGKNLFNTPKKEENRGVKHTASDSDSLPKDAKKQKKEHILSDSESEGEDDKKNYVSLPHMPKLLDGPESPSSRISQQQHANHKSKSSPMKRVNSDSSLNSQKSSGSNSKKTNGDSNLSHSQLSSSQKPKSLVPYDSHDEDSASSDSDKKEEKVKNQSGIWHVCPLKDVCPSKQGSTVESTKEELNGFSGSSPKVNGGNGIRNGGGKDVVHELEKFSHRGYGAPVNSWKGHQTHMDRELVNDRQEERKRQFEDDRDTEQDRGRVKKIKYGHHNDHRGMNANNPFHERQNSLNRSQTHQQNFQQRGSNNYNGHRFFHSRPNNNGYNFNSFNNRKNNQKYSSYNNHRHYHQNHQRR